MGKTKINLFAVPSSMKQEERIDATLKLLGLEGMRSSLNYLANKAVQNKKTPHSFLESLLEHELAWKEESRLIRWTQQAHFPSRKTLLDFDFDFQPSIDQRQIDELASCRFIDKTENVVFFGPAGVGKTHLAIALGIEAVSKGYEVRFLTLDQLIELVEKTTESEELKRLFATLTRPRLLILDEIDLYETSTAASTFLFKLLHHRYERGSVIFTSNKTFTEWEKIFGSRERAGAIIDRITHHCTIININGESYRIKDKLQKKLP